MEKLKISDKIEYFRVDELEPHPWNFNRTPSKSEQTQEEKDEQEVFDKSIRRNGVEIPILVTLGKNSKGNYEILRGRRRFTSVKKAIANGQLPENYKIPGFRLISSEETIEEAIYGDNDQGRKYTPDERRKIIVDRFGLENLLEEGRGGNRGNQIVGGRKAEEEGIVKQVHARFPWWPIGTLQRDVAVIRRTYSNVKKFREPEDETIPTLNTLVRSWYENYKERTRLEKEKQEALEKIAVSFNTKIQKKEGEMRFFAQDFRPYGGIENYILKAWNSRRPEFQGVKKLRGLDEIVEELKAKK
ncbi:ParB N-terminal domain-containing protein [Leptospira levettii]|uniref:ParB N-terminal domain-containing protein n=1 Tax=Leptospira levettii TaxID=2023178 RepID=UPI0013FD9419|nr:ParB N-terminal domain-containing protein [Leptospira levettii]